MGSKRIVATKNKALEKPAVHAPNTLVIRPSSAEEVQNVLARTAVAPTANAALTLKEYSAVGDQVELMALIDALADQTKAATEGNLRRAESILVTQAHTLDAVFNNLARRAIRSERMDHLDSYLQLALRAQRQCRTTLEAFAGIKNPPPVAFVKQANIANGPQQVNNGVQPARQASRTRDTKNPHNGVLEAQDGERMDTGTPGATIGADPTMATVEKIDRAKNPRR